MAVVSNIGKVEPETDGSKARVSAFNKALWERMRARDKEQRDLLAECEGLLAVAAAVVRDDGNDDRADRMEAAADRCGALAAGEE